MTSHGMALLAQAKASAQRGEWDAALGSLKEAETALKLGAGEAGGACKALREEISAGVAKRDAESALDGAEQALRRGEVRLVQLRPLRVRCLCAALPEGETRRPWPSRGNTPR